MDLNFLPNYNRMGSWNTDPIPLGDKYKKVAFAANITGVTENATVTISNSYGLRNLAYTPGQSVRVTKASDPTTRFEGIVDSYTQTQLVLREVTDISGTFGLTNYTINLVGERGSKITAGTGVPLSGNGRPGDIYIDNATGFVYIKQ